MGQSCSKRKKKIPESGSTLDRVISQASNQDQCFLYKLANYKKGGELIDAFNIGGVAEVEKLMREQFGQLMYQDGKGHIINRAEYLRWKFRDYEQVVLPIEASLSPLDPLSKWTDHDACWQMQYRGSLGESLLHLLIICDTKIHTKLARILLKCFPHLSVDVVEGEEYLGASSLHLAIAYNNNELVQDLVEAGANVNQRAIGSFFLPRDQQRLKPAKHTDYEGLAYLGEYPLAWAACCANESVYNLLLDSGANPDYQDNFGNMILHMVVVCDKLDMFGYALRHPKLPASNGIVNRDGLTPLTLACKLGRAEVFREMLELSSKEFWRYSNITCSGYTLNALDTLLPDGSTNWNSALFIILNGTKQEHLNMLDGGIIQRLLEEKWKTFVRKQFLKRLLIFLVHLILMSVAIYLRPEDPDEPLILLTADPLTIVRYMAEAGTMVGVLHYVIIQQGDEIKNQGLCTFLKQQSHSPAKAIFLISNLLIIACIPYRLMKDRLTEEAILAFAVPGSWFLLMFFAGAVRLTGPFVTMIYSMITGDMLTFGIIYMIVLFGFSQSFYFLYKGFPNLKNSLYNSYTSTWMALFQITLGNYDYQELGQTTYPSLSKSVFILFMVFVPILLLNMLIAMMGNTYAHVIEQSEKEYTKQWAKIVVTLERAIPQADAHRYLQEYSISLGPSDDPSTEQRAVVVIKLKNKTKAKQRKGSVANWKRVGKVTINALRKRGLTGEELRCLMWGRESINTPVIDKRTKADASMATKAPDVAGAFGEALSTALDVMAFTHDFDISGAAQGLNLAKNYTEGKEQDKSLKRNDSINVTKKVVINTVVGTKCDTTKGFQSVKQLGKLNTSCEETSVVAQPGIPVLVKTSSLTLTDPLRELVLCSNNVEQESQKLNDLAAQAARLPSIEELSLKTPSSGVNVIASIFVGTDNLAQNAQVSTRKKYAALEPSDSEGFGADGPLLGKISRARRAKSASKRNVAADKLKLVDSDSTSSLDAASNIRNNSLGFDYTDSRIKEVMGIVQKEVEQAVISEVLNIQGEGTGVDLQGAIVKPKSKKIRSKTAKPNSPLSDAVRPDVLPDAVLSVSEDDKRGMPAVSKGEAMIFHNHDATVEYDDTPSALHEEIQYIGPEPLPPAGTSVEDENCVEGAESDSSFNPSHEEFDSDSTVDNEDIENDTGVANRLESLGSKNRAEECDTKQQKRRRNAKAKPEEWKRNKNKCKRMKGEEYTGVRKDQCGKKTYSVNRVAKKLGLPCPSSECRRVKTRACASISEADRERLFIRFWQHMDWKQRKVYVSSLVSLKERNRVRKARADSPSRRTGTLHYHLKINDELYPVCKTLFLSTFGLGEWTVRNWTMKGMDGMHQSTPSNNNVPARNVERDEKKDFAAEFLNRLSKTPSHYCRVSTSKEYLEPMIESKSELHRLYLETCKNEGRIALARKQFLEIFKVKNLGLFQPKKDQCDTCIGYKYKQVPEEDYEQHVKRKEERREQKKQEKEKALRGEQLTYTMDLQAVKLSPMLKASALYYKMKLCVHNFTIHNIATKDVACYVWNESGGGLVASVFASCVTDFLVKETEKSKINSVVIISDDCTYQDRNAALGNALLKLAVDKSVTITQHYLEKGHTQMEVDSVHSTIEGKLKNKEIHLPSDYARICKEARPKQPYQVHYLDYTFFKNFASVHYVTSIRPGKGPGDPVVTDVCSYKYSPNGEIHYKINVSDEWLQLPQCMKKGPFEAPHLYTARLKIASEKFAHLQELKKVIPRDCHGYYDDLPHS